jgi:sugar phosphate permease
MARNDREPRSIRPTRVRWLVFLLAWATSWLLYLHRYAWGVIKPNVKAELGLTDVELGWLDSAFNASYAAFQIPTGLLGDLLGPATVLPSMIFGWSACLASTGAAGGFWMLASVRGFFGALQAGAYPNLSKVTRRWFPFSVRTTVQGLVATLAGRSGGACASILVGTLLLGKLGLGWRAALVWIAVAGVALAVLFRTFYRDDPARHPWVNEAERELIGAEEPPATGGAPVAAREGSPGAKPKVAAFQSFAGLLLHMFTAAFGDMLYVYWILLFLEEGRGLDKAEAGVYASLPLWGGAFGGTAGGMLNDLLVRLRGRRFARRAMGLSGKLASAVLVTASLGFEDGRQAMMVLAAARFFGDWSQPTLWGTITDVGGRAVGSLFGVINMAGSIGAAAAGPVLGAIKQEVGWNAVFWTIAGVDVVSGLSWLLIDAGRRLWREAGPPETS